MKNKIVKLLGLAAVASSAVLGITTEAQTNIIFGKGITNLNYLNPDQTTWCWTNAMDGSLMAQDGHYIISPQRIQLSAKISGEVVTNWTATSVTTPVVPPGEENYAIYRATTLNQSGVIISNTLATIQWHGKPVTVILETTQIGTANRQTWR